MITIQAPHLQIASRWHQRTIVIVDGIAQGIIIGVHLSTRLQQLHLIGKTPFGKHPYGFLDRGFRTAERHIGIDNLLHPLTDLCHIVISQWGTILLLEIAVDASGQRVFDEEFATREHIVCSLVEHEAERTGIHTTT